MIKMLTIGQTMNGYKIVAVVTQFRAGAPDGAVILGTQARADDRSHFVTAVLDQVALDQPEPVESWFWGHYFDGAAAAEVALADFTERAGLRPIIAGRK